MTTPTPPVVDDTLDLIAATLLAHQPELDYVPRWCRCDPVGGGKPYTTQAQAYAGWVAHIRAVYAAARSSAP